MLKIKNMNIGGDLPPYLLDVMLFYKITHLVDIDPSLRPIVRRSSRPTRSSADTRTKFVVLRCKTTTFQRAFMVRITRMWNHLVDELALSPDTSFSSFKTSMHKYYLSALNMCYDVDDPRTYKTVCVKCNSVRIVLLYRHYAVRKSFLYFIVI